MAWLTQWHDPREIPRLLKRHSDKWTVCPPGQAPPVGRCPRPLPVLLWAASCERTDQEVPREGAPQGGSPPGREPPREGAPRGGSPQGGSPPGREPPGEGAPRGGSPPGREPPREEGEEAAFGVGSSEVLPVRIEGMRGSVRGGLTRA